MPVSEAKVLLSADHLGRVAIVRRPDGLFCLYRWWHWDVGTQRAFNVVPVEHRTWSASFDPKIYDDKQPLAGLYGKVEDAEREAVRLLGLNGN